MQICVWAGIHGDDGQRQGAYEISNIEKLLKLLHFLFPFLMIYIRIYHKGTML